MFCFTTCTPKIEKVQIWSRVIFVSILAKVKKNTKKNVSFSRFFTLFFLLFALMSGVRELLGHALCNLLETHVYLQLICHIRKTILYFIEKTTALVNSPQPYHRRI